MLWSCMIPVFWTMLMSANGYTPRRLSIDIALLQHKVDNLAERLLTCKDMVGFSVGIVQNGHTLMTKGYGLADIANQKPVTEDTLFGIASLSKAFTTTLLVYLVDQHPEYTLDTPLREILGEDLHFPTCQLTTHATLTDLMSHRTGMLPSNTVRMQDDLTRDAFFKKLRFFGTKSDFRSTYNYNNLMYGLLSKVTEVVGGDSWENLMRRYIFDPLGMDSTTFTHTANLSSDQIALGYQRDWRQNYDWQPVSQRIHRQWGQMGGSGSILSSSTDLVKWLHFQLSLGKDADGNQVMPESVVTQTHTPVMVIPDCGNCQFYRKPYLNVTYDRNTYGLGWRVGAYRGERLVTHTGYTWGFTGVVVLLPDAGMALHVSVTGVDSNYEGRRVLIMYIMDLLLGVEPQVTLDNACNFPYYDRNATQQQTAISYYDNLPRSPQPVDLEDVQPYIGTYGHFGFGNLTVFYNQSLQMLQMTYGQLGLWDLFKSDEQEHEYIGLGYGDIVNVVLSSLVFHSVTHGDGRMTHLTVWYFEPEDPPVFERGLQMADAPAPSECDTTCSKGNNRAASLWTNISSLGCILYTILTVTMM